MRILIADDHPVFRDGLRALLESAGFAVVGEAGDGDEAVRLAVEAAPDVVLMDLHMPVSGGEAATERIVRQGAGGPAVLVLTMFDDDDAVHGAIRAGASGYVLKDAEQDALLRAIRAWPPARPSSGRPSPPGSWPTWRPGNATARSPSPSSPSGTRRTRPRRPG